LDDDIFVKNMNFIPRLLENIVVGRLFKAKVIVIYGARQVGKTTLVKRILERFGNDGRYLNCELLPVQEGLSKDDPESIRAFLGKYRVVVLDEAQNIEGIEKKLKIIVDELPDIQIIATGSSAFEFANAISEPLTGRSFKFVLYPLSFKEVEDSTDLINAKSKIEFMMRYGLFPEVFSLSESEAKERLIYLVSDYLYKDIFGFERLKKSTIIKNLLQLIALQIGSEVSYNELAQKIEINRLTVLNYLDILEQNFIIFRLNSFSRNLRNEISRGVKIYFYDLGIRNALINNFNPLNLRSDVGALWENFCILERKKLNDYNLRHKNTYFWRTYDQKEIDYIEEADGGLKAYEFKWGSTHKSRFPEEFARTYGGEFEVVDRENFYKFLNRD